MDVQYRFLFGPVRSRRLGRSLGIDLVPFKVCTYDCPYCQVGGTVTKTLERGEYVPTAEVMAEFDRWLAQDGQADCLTLSGAGEPTLHSRFGEILRHVKSRCSLRRVLLSNGSLFYLKDVREAAVHADVIKATLGGWDEASFEAVHHPAAGLRFDVFLDGLRAMRAAFAGEYWLEIFLMAGVNDSDEAVARLAALAEEIGPDRIHLNTAVRPPHDTRVQPVSQERLAELMHRFKPEAEAPLGNSLRPVSANGDRQVQQGSGSHAAATTTQDGAPLGTAATTTQDGAPMGATMASPLEEDRVLQLIRRHPCTADDAAVALGMEMTQVTRALESLVARKAVKIEWRDGKPYMVGNG